MPLRSRLREGLRGHISKVNDGVTMKILAADTTTTVNTVAVCDGARLLAETVVTCHRAHSERLLATVDWVLREAGLRLCDLDALAISHGPGSFTGVRVGVATWKGLALGAALPLVAVPTLDAMTRLGAFRDGLVCPLLDAKMGEVFGALYRFEDGVRTKLTPDRVCLVEDLLRGVEGLVVVLGDAVSRYRARIQAAAPQARFLDEWCAVPRASAVAAEAHALIAAGACTDPALVAAIYLRKSQAEENRAKQRAAKSEPS